jgi:hypothetical protein
MLGNAVNINASVYSPDWREPAVESKRPSARSDWFLRILIGALSPILLIVSAILVLCSPFALGEADE